MTKDSYPSLRNQIYENMRLKETDELLEIWKHGKHEEWSDTAFEVVKELLLERLGEVPSQELETIEQEPNDEPYINYERLLKISLWSNTLSWVILSLYIINFFVMIVLHFQELFAVLENIGLYSIHDSVYQVYSWIDVVKSLAVGIMYFLILQAISEGIFLLIDEDEDDSN